MKNQKGFVPVIIIMMVLVGIAGFYLLENFKSKKSVTVSPLPISDSLTTDWKTYSDQSGGFSINYPNEWNVRESKSEGTLLSISSVKYPTNTPGGNAGIFFFSTKNDKNLKLLDWVKKYGHNQGRLPSNVYSETHINNIPAIEINYTWTNDFSDWLNKNYPVTDTEGPPPMGTKFREISLQNNDRIITMQTSFLPRTENDTYFFIEVDQILSTFKFTK